MQRVRVRFRALVVILNTLGVIKVADLHEHHEAGTLMLLTMQRRPRWAAGQTRYWAGASSDSASSAQDAAASSHASATCSSSSYGSRSIQLLLDFLQAGALLKPRHPVDHPGGHVCAGARSAAIRVDRKDVGGAAEGADGHPATVLGETHILDLGRQRMKKKFR